MDSIIEVTVIDAIGMLVEEDINGGGLGDTGHFQVLRPSGIRLVHARVCGIGSGTNSPAETSAAVGKKPEEIVHGIAANPGLKPCPDLPGGESTVGRTMVNALAFTVRAQNVPVELQSGLVGIEGIPGGGRNRIEKLR